MCIEVGKRIRTARLNKQLTQEDLALKIGISSRTIKSYEANAEKMNLNTMKKISLICEVSEIWLLTGKENTNQNIGNKNNNNIQFNGHNNGTININSSSEMSHEICKEIIKLPIKKIEYFYHLIKAEILKEE